MSEELIKRSSITELVKVYQESVGTIESCFKQLEQVEKNMQLAFGAKHSHYFRILSCHNPPDLEHPERTVERIRRETWKALVERLEVRRILSVARTNELDKQLESGEGLPAIETDAILVMLTGLLGSMDKFLDEACQETLKMLIPDRTAHKTNGHFQVGKRVVLTRCISYDARHGVYVHLNYSREPELRALDNTFHSLDGKGSIKSARGELVDSLSATICQRPLVRTGETEYFKYKWHNNGTLHIEFKRMDLVAQLNSRANKWALPGNQNAADNRF